MKNTDKKLHLAVRNGLLLEIGEILTNFPAILNKRNKQGRSILYLAAYEDKDEVIDCLINHGAYRSLGTQEKCELLRDVVDGSIRLAHDLNLRGQPENAIKTFEKAISYNKKIVDNNEDDYLIWCDALYHLAHLCLKHNKDEKAFDALRDAIFIDKKIKNKNDHDYCRLVYCCNALGKLYVKRNRVEEAIPLFKKAYHHCKMISEENTNKPRLLATVENNLAALYRVALLREAKNWGYECKENTERGDNSLAYAVMEQLHAQNSALCGQLSLADLLNMQARHTAEFHETYENEPDNQEFHGYLDWLIQDGQWTRAQILKFLVFSRALNVNLLIVRAGAGVPIILKQAQAVATLCLGFEVGQLYHSLMPRSDWPTTLSIQGHLNRAVNDNYHSLVSRPMPAQLRCESSLPSQDQIKSSFKKRVHTDETVKDLRHEGGQVKQIKVDISLIKSHSFFVFGTERKKFLPEDNKAEPAAKKSCKSRLGA